MSYQRHRFWTSGLDAQQESLIRRFIKITLPHAGANAPIAGYACGMAAVSRPCTPKSADEVLWGGKRKQVGLRRPTEREFEKNEKN